MNLQDRLEIIRMEKVSRDLLRYNLIHTSFMVYYAEHPHLSEDGRKEGLLRTINELELVYQQNVHDIPSILKPFIEEQLKCAKDDVLNGDYWSAISDVDSLEVSYLSEYLPYLPNLEREAYAHILLAMKAAKKIGGEIIIKTEPSEQ